MSLLADKLLEGWQKHNWLSRALIPVSWIYRGLIALRVSLYRIGVLRSELLPLPVIIVGNLTVGGTGKTPVVTYLVDYLRDTGWSPGIISRGYGGNSNTWPVEVQPGSDPGSVGDEPVLLANRCQCPVVVGPNRLEDARLLIKNHRVDLIISDDGLQHYMLQRDVEIAVTREARDGDNRSMLPAGPYREPLTRLETVDLVVTRGDSGDMQLQVGKPVRVDGLKEDFQHSGRVHGVAGIAVPEDFFEYLGELDLDVIAHPFPDHHPYRLQDLDFGDDLPILMTEKDAVKCREFAKANYWLLPVTVEFGREFNERLDILLAQLDQPEPAA